MINYASVFYSLLLALSTIALAQTNAIAQPFLSQKFKSAHANLIFPNLIYLHNRSNLPTQENLFGKPGMPKRRVGGGTRLY